MHEAMRRFAIPAALVAAVAVFDGGWSGDLSPAGTTGVRSASAEGEEPGHLHLPLVLMKRRWQPSPSPTPTRSETPGPVPTTDGSGWLDLINYHRGLAGLPGVTENTEWSRGDALHSRYMVENYVIAHSEDPANEFYTAEGNEAAANGNVYLMAATGYRGSYSDAIEGWMTGPFHMLAIIDPHLVRSGFGEYAKDVDRWHRYGATLDVGRGREALPASVTYPVYYPAPGGYMPHLAYDGGESPDPLEACPGYEVPTGPPIALQLGEGDGVPDVTASTLRSGGAAQEHCTFDETTYPNAYGRAGLGMRDAVVIMPRRPLAAGRTYEVTIEANGRVHAWSFVAGR